MQNESEIAELIADVREHVLYLQELGVAGLGVKLPEPARETAVADDQRPAKLVMADDDLTQSRGLQNTISKSRLAELPSLSGSIASTTATAGRKASTSAKTPDPPATVEIRAPLENAAKVETITDVRDDIGECVRCGLCAERTQVVHTTGNFKADLMFVGEAPGADEDKQGTPFVGRAGQLLTKMIEGIGFKREEVCIGNINRCRPPGNRAPTLAEAETCKPFLLREIAIVKPKVIVVLGNTATHNLLNTNVGITRLRGEFQDYYGVKVMPTFHPAFLLRDPRKKQEVWEDLKKVRDHLSSSDQK
ncbi:MAG: uracil-DNA glycosylase [Pyrinomonadaceae bacterium]